MQAELASEARRSRSNHHHPRVYSPLPTHMFALSLPLAPVSVAGPEPLVYLEAAKAEVRLCQTRMYVDDSLLVSRDICHRQL